MNDTPNIYKKWEYKNYLKLIEGKDILQAIIYAKLIKIDNRTLEKWYQQPELQTALFNALDEIVANMKRAGKDDWKYYREILKIMGLEDTNKLDVTSGGESINNPYKSLTPEQLRKLAGE